MNIYLFLESNLRRHYIVNYISDFSSRSDLIEKYTNNSLLLYALQLRFNIDDIVSVASDSLTDGGGDKKCDLIY